MISCGVRSVLKRHGKWLSPVGLVAMFSSAAGLVLFTFKGEYCRTEIGCVRRRLTVL